MRHTAPKLRGHGGISFSWHLGVLVISDIGPIIFRHHEPTNLKTTFAILGLIGFLASAIAHVVTFFGIDPSILCSVDLGASCRNICRFITLSKEDCSTYCAVAISTLVEIPAWRSTGLRPC